MAACTRRNPADALRNGCLPRSANLSGEMQTVSPGGLGEDSISPRALPGSACTRHLAGPCWSTSRGHSDLLGLNKPCPPPDSAHRTSIPSRLSRSSLQSRRRGQGHFTNGPRVSRETVPGTSMLLGTAVRPKPGLTLDSRSPDSARQVSPTPHRRGGQGGPVAGRDDGSGQGQSSLTSQGLEMRFLGRERRSLPVSPRPRPLRPATTSQATRTGLPGDQVSG